MFLKFKNSLVKILIFFKHKKQRFNLKLSFSLLALFLFIAVIVSIPIHGARAGLFGELVSFNLFGIIENFLADLIVNNNFVVKIFNFFIFQILNTFLNLATILVYFAAWLVDVFLDPDIYKAVFDVSTVGTAVNIGWTTVRDFCNLFFIFFLLLIAFATILRIQTYKASNLLPKFIISLFLINFSAVIAMMVIDFGQVFMYEIIKWMGSGGFGTSGSALTSIVDYFNNTYNFIPAGGYSFENVVGVGFALAYSSFLIFVYVMLSVFLLIRLVSLAILIIVSPFAFLSIVLPEMKKHTNEWFNSLIKNTLFGPVFIFFIYLSTVMMTSLSTYSPSAPIPESARGLSIIVSVFIPHVVSISFLLFAPIVANKLGMYGASSLVGGRFGLGNVTMGTFGAAKLTRKYGKKVGTIPRTAHILAKQNIRKYREGVSKSKEWIKGKKFIGKFSILWESKDKKNTEESVDEAEKALKHTTSKGRIQIINDTIGPRSKADYIEATFNRLGTKDNGFDLSEKELIKAGLKNKDGSLDREKIKKLFNQAEIAGRYMGEAKKFMPFTIEDEKERHDMFDEMIEKDEINKVKAEHFADGDEEYLRKKMGDREFEDLFMKKKSQTEKDAFREKKEEKLATMFDENGEAKPGKENEIKKLRVEIARLASSNNKIDKLKKIELKNGKIEFSGELDHDVARDLVEKMTPAEVGRQNKDFHVAFAYNYDAKQVDGVFKDRDSSAEVKIAIEESIKNKIKEISEKREGKKAKKGEEENFDRLMKNLEKMGSKITRATKDKQNKRQRTERPEDIDRDVF